MFFFQGYHVSKFFSVGFGSERSAERSLCPWIAEAHVHACHVSFTQLKTEKNMLWKLSSHREFESSHCVRTFFFSSAWKLWDCHDLGKDEMDKSEDRGNWILKKNMGGQRAEKRSVNKLKAKFFYRSTIDYISSNTEHRNCLRSVTYCSYRSCRLLYLVF